MPAPTPPKEEFELQMVAKNPSDAFEKGLEKYRAEEYPAAILSFQLAVEDMTLRPKAMYYLGRCFSKIGWLHEAAGSLRKGLEYRDQADDKLVRRLEVRLDQVMSKVDRN